MRRKPLIVDNVSQWLVDSYALSYREAEVVMLVSKGLRNAEIARQLFITEKTIKFHLTNSFKRLGVKSRTGACALVWDKGPREGMKAAHAATTAQEMASDMLPCGAV